MKIKLSWIVRRFGFTYGREDMQQDLEVIKLEEGDSGFLRCKSRAIDILRRHNRYEAILNREMDVDLIPNGDAERTAMFGQFSKSLSSREKEVLKMLLDNESFASIAARIKGTKYEVRQLSESIKIKIKYFLF